MECRWLQSRAGSRWFLRQEDSERDVATAPLLSFAAQLSVAWRRCFHWDRKPSRTELPTPSPPVEIECPRSFPDVPALCRIPFALWQPTPHDPPAICKEPAVPDAPPYDPPEERWIESWPHGD